jgi:hypothetical protein
MGVDAVEASEVESRSEGVVRAGFVGSRVASRFAVTSADGAGVPALMFTTANPANTAPRRTSVRFSLQWLCFRR